VSHASPETSQPAIPSALEQIRQILSQQPDRQAVLFALKDSDLFVTELLQLADQIGVPLTHQALANALRQGGRQWLERDLP
jgi:hypothetical protein